MWFSNVQPNGGRMQIRMWIRLPWIKHLFLHYDLWKSFHRTKCCFTIIFIWTFFVFWFLQVFFIIIIIIFFVCSHLILAFFSLTIFRHVRRKRTGVNCKMNRPYSHVSNHDQGGKDDVILLYSRLDTHTELFHHFVSDQQLKRQQRVKIWWSLVHISSYNSSLVRCQRTVNATTDHFMSLMSLFGSDAWYHRKGVNYSNLLAHIALN